MSGIKPLGNGFTRLDWAKAFAPEANDRVLNWVCGWTCHETNPGDQQGCDGYNLLNTHLGCEGGGGPSQMCCAGDTGHIRRFTSLQEGAQGNRSVLSQGFPGYKAINDALSSNDIDTLNTSGEVAQGLYTWVGFHTYDWAQGTFEATGAVRRADIFPYGTSGGGTGSGGNSGNSGGVGSDINAGGEGSVCTLGIPGQCNGGYTCVAIGPSGRPLCDSTFVLPWSPARCISNSEFINGTAYTDRCDNGSGSICTGGKCADGSTTPTGPQIFGLDVHQITKGTIGVLLLIFGGLLLVNIMSGGKVAQVAGKAATSVIA